MRGGILGQTCNESTIQSFLWPLVAPPGAGLDFWGLDAPNGSAVWHNQRYQVDRLYTFSGRLPHAPGTMAYRERWRVTLQAFAARCGERWVLYH